jgi:CHAT domain-containing protein
MTQHIEERSIRKYLLNELGDDEPRRRIEERLMLDEGFYGVLEAAEEDLIDEYLRGALSVRERADFERHFLSTPERREKLGFARAFNAYLSRAAPQPRGLWQRAADALASWLRPPRLRAYATAAALVIVVLAAGLLAWRVVFRRNEVAEGLTALRTAYSRVRPVESRVTGLGYARLAEARGPEDGQVDKTSRELAETLLLKAARDNPVPDSQHALGRLYLYERKFDDAVKQLDAAAAADPNDAQLRSDLGAALLERGKDEHARGDDGAASLDFGLSLEHLDRALALDPALADALFNRAVLDEHMALDAKAEEDWRGYLQKDSSSPWADEARRRLRQLEERRERGARERETSFEEFAAAFRDGDAERAWGPLGRSRSRTGNAIVERLVDSYLEAHAAGRADEAAENLRMLSFAGDVEERQAGDRFTSDLARFYRDSPPARLEQVAHARALMREGQARFYASEYDDALGLYAEAGRGFAQSGDSCEALVADEWLGFCQLRIPDLQKARATFEHLAAAFDANGYAALHAQAVLALGDASASAAELSRARAYAESAMEESEKIAFTENAVRCLQLFAILDRRVGRYTEALGSSLRGITRAQSLAPNPTLVWGFYVEAGDDFAALQHPDTALEFEKEALRLALESKLPAIVERSYARLSQVYLKRKDYDEAIRNGQLAVEQGRGIAGEKSRNNTVANALLHLGHVYRQSRDYARAVECYDQSIAFYEVMGLNVYELEAHRARLLTYEAERDDAAAGRELETLLALLEKYRQRIREVENRDSFFDTNQNVYDAATDFAYTRLGDPRRAFDYAERAHARTLLDLMRGDSEAVEGRAGKDIRPALTTEPLTLEEIQQRMPERAQILQYHVLEDKLLIWLVSKEKVESRVAEVGGDDLSAKVTAYLKSVREGTDGGRASLPSKELYSILVGPVESSLDAGAPLCIVPDKILNYLPFAALVSPATGRYLVEERAALLAPGASVFVVASETASGKERGGGETALAVGDPAFDPDKFASLPPLPAAGDEARKVAALYGARALVGTEARESEVTRAMRGADVIHLASHYVIDKNSPMLSRLLLAREGTQPARADAQSTRGDAQGARDAALPTHEDAPGTRDSASDGELQAFEVYRMKLPRARLVVLSACQTGPERVYRGEGAVGIARPFIAAGAPLVVASLWPVESDSTADLMVSFHRHRKLDGLPTLEALRRAQLDMLASTYAPNTQPVNWAAFAVIGGSANF